MDDRYDETLFEILKEAKTVPHFFDIVFGFMYRRTDFYHIAIDPNLGVGLPEGIAEKLLLQSFKRHIYNKIDVFQPKDNVVQPELREEVVTAEETREIIPKRRQSESVESSKKGPGLDFYNGAAYENYSWSQTITDVDIQVKFPEKITSKNLFVDITQTKISVSVKGAENPVLTGDLCKKCKPQETIWSLDGCILQIHVEKASESWWDCLVQSEPRLDLSKMDCSRPFYELSDEAQAKIEELSWNQERKRQGLPTSDQLEMEKTLRKAWNAEGSPFSGEFDPSKVTLS